MSLNPSNPAEKRFIQHAKSSPQRHSEQPIVIGVEEDTERYPISDMAGVVTSEALATLDQEGQSVPYGIDMVQARDVWDVNRDVAGVLR